MMVKSGLIFFFYLKIERAPSEIPANLPGQFSLSGQICLHWAAAATLKRLGAPTYLLLPLAKRGSKWVISIGQWGVFNHEKGAI